MHLTYWYILNKLKIFQHKTVVPPLCCKKKTYCFHVCNKKCDKFHNFHKNILRARLFLFFIVPISR